MAAKTNLFFGQANSPALRKVNNLLTIVIVTMAAYMLVLPYLPNLSLWLKQRSDKTSGFIYQSVLAEETLGKSEALAPKPKDNRLVIPKIQLDQPIVEGLAANTVDKGVWRRPKTSSPDKGGNTVLVGHRYTYSNPATFYHLDKLAVGDKYTLFWQGVEYDYELVEVRTVLPSAVEVEGPTDEPRLTLYTCTPLWNASRRLVLVAKLIGKSS